MSSALQALLLDAPARRAYWQKVTHIERANLIQACLHNEAAGSVAIDRSPEGNNGAYTDVSLGQPGIGGGLTSALFVPEDSINNIYSAGLVADFSGEEGTYSHWLKMRAASVWTDLDPRWSFVAHADGDNHIYGYKSSTNNRYILLREAQNVRQTITVESMTTVDWFLATLTWSKAADQVIGYIDDAQSGSILTGLSSFVGDPLASNFAWGALNTGPASVTDGYLGPAFLWNKALTAAQVKVVAKR